MLFLADKIHEFHAGAPVRPKHAKHRARDTGGVLLFNSAHSHTEVHRFNDHRHTERIERFLEAIRNLVRETLLNLKPPRENIDDTRNL